MNYTFIFGQPQSYKKGMNWREITYKLTKN